jgi:hypothetical protein
MVAGVSLALCVYTLIAGSEPPGASWYSVIYTPPAPANFPVIIVPYWPTVMLLAIAPGVWVWKRTKQRNRQRDGLCRVCGYDLRATPQRCPECGTLFRTAKNGAVEQ